MKKFGMGTLIALTVAGLSLATLGGCEKKTETKKTETTKKETTETTKKPADPKTP